MFHFITFKFKYSLYACSIVAYTIKLIKIGEKKNEIIFDYQK